MAIYKLASGASRILGSRQGSTFQRCGVNFAIRQRKKPFPRRTARTSRSRSSFHNVQAHYRTLSSGDKTSWDNDIASFPRTDSLGNTYELSGPQLFNAHNATLVNQELSIIDTSQAPVTFPTFINDSNSFSVGSSEFLIQVSTPDSFTGFELHFFSSRAFNIEPATTYVPPVIFMASITGVSPVQINIFDEWVARYGDPSELVGSFIRSFIRLLDVSSGQLSTLLGITTEITS